METQGMQTVTIMDVPDDKIYMIMPSQRMYMEMSMGQIQKMAEQMQHDTMDIDKDIDVTKTGRMETIAGHRCEHWIISSSTGKVDACMAKGIGTFMQGRTPMSRGRSEPAWQREAREQGAFPLTVADDSGKVLFQVTQIERKSLDASLFQPPSDFQKMSMPGMPGMPERP